MRIVVSDTSCLIDLRKASLLEPFLELPYEILIPNALFEDELFKFTAAQKRALLRGGLKVVDLPGEQVLRARHFVQKAPRLSIHDGFALALAEFHAGCILLTGDGALRALALGQSIEVHGVLWVIDQIHASGASPPSVLRTALAVLATDPVVRLPKAELNAAIRRYDDLAT